MVRPCGDLWAASHRSMKCAWLGNMKPRTALPKGSHTSPLNQSHVFKQVTCRGNFGQECFIEGEVQQPRQPIPSSYFLVQQGLLYQHTEW